jgi:hypothetical protein
VIKVCVDCEGYPYSVEQMKFFVSDAANGMRAACQVQTEKGARNAIEAAVWSIEHGRALTDELLQTMKAKDIFRVGTDFPMTSYHRRSAEGGRRVGVKSVFSTGFDYLRPGHDARRRSDRRIDYVESGRSPAGGHPQGDDDLRLSGAPGRTAARSNQGGTCRRNSTDKPLA